MPGHIKEVRRGRFRIVVEAGKDPATGKRKRIVRYFEGRKSEAEDYMAELLAQVNTGTYVKPTRITVAEWLKQWIDSRTDLAPKTQEDYRSYIEKHLIPALGAIPLDQLQPMHIDEYKKKELAKKLSANSVNRYLTVLHAALKHAVEMRLLRDNPASHVRRPKVAKKEPRALSMEELQQLLAALEKDVLLYRVCMFTAFTGLRRSEVLGLKWANVDLADGAVYVRETRQRLKGRWVEKGPKSDAGLRRVPLSSTLVAMLKNIRAEQEARRGQPDYHNEDLVFCQPNGKPIWPSNFERRFRKAADAAGFPDFTFHGLRHTFATLLLKDGAYINVVQRLLGHEKPSTTIDLYGHALPGLQQEAVAKLDAAFRGHQMGTKKKLKRYKLKR
jgi:integrase